MKLARRSPWVAVLVLAAAALGVLARRSHRDVSRAPTAASASDDATSEPSIDEARVTTTAEPPAAVSAARPAPPAAMDEPALMTLLRSANGNDPRLALELAREGNRRFPESSDAPERTSILIHALADLGQASEARGEAEHMVNHYPDSHWVREIELFTGAHRRRNVVLDDAGRLKFVDPPPS